MELLLSSVMGLGLAASAGFRVFVPLFILSLAANSGHVTLNSDMAVIASTPAMVTLGVATLLEVGAYYFPLVDNMLDAVATPAAVMAGTVAMAATSGGTVSPYMTWGLALIVGGGAAGTVQVGTVKARAVSAMTTGGAANPLVSTGENGSAVVVAGASVLFPVVGAVLALGLGCWLVMRGRRK